MASPSPGLPATAHRTPRNPGRNSIDQEQATCPLLDRVRKGYHAEGIIEQCAKLDEAGIRCWHTSLNGAADRERIGYRMRSEL